MLCVVLEIYGATRHPKHRCYRMQIENARRTHTCGIPKIVWRRLAAYNKVRIKSRALPFQMSIISFVRAYVIVMCSCGSLCQGKSLDNLKRNCSAFEVGTYYIFRI